MRSAPTPDDSGTVASSTFEIAVTLENWERLKPLFEEALSLPPEERAAFLEKVRRDDEELGRNLAQLVASNAATRTLDISLMDFPESPRPRTDSSKKMN